MTTVRIKTDTHPAEADLAAYLSKSLPGKEMARIEGHIASCAGCLEIAVAAYDSVRDFKPPRSSLPITLAMMTSSTSWRTWPPGRFA